MPPFNSTGRRPLFFTAIKIFEVAVDILPLNQGGIWIVFSGAANFGNACDALQGIKWQYVESIFRVFLRAANSTTLTYQEYRVLGPENLSRSRGAGRLQGWARQCLPILDRFRPTVRQDQKIFPQSY
jgi:hypothetical protein